MKVRNYKVFYGKFGGYILFKGIYIILIDLYFNIIGYIKLNNKL